MTPEEQAAAQEAENKAAAEEAALRAAGTDNGDGTITQPDGRVVVLHPSAYKRIREESRARGKKEAMNEIEAAAKAAGFSSLQEALAAAFRGGPSRSNGHRDRHDQRNGQGNRNGQERQLPVQAVAPGPAPTPPNSHSDRKAWDRYERARQQWEKDRDVYRRRIASESNKRRDLQRQLDAKDAEMSLRETAVAVGVKDVDYALRLLTRHLEGKPEEELKDFDECKFFEGLREGKPYLFGESVVPATTGTNGNTPIPPKPGTTAAANAKDAQVDAREMKQEEFTAKLQKMGLDRIGL
jgi:hypothetical protein